ncbi:MAG: hypothetical protein ACHQF2_03570 [Flavobacteriales bacterium]
MKILENTDVMGFRENFQSARKHTCLPAGRFSPCLFGSFYSAAFIFVNGPRESRPAVILSGVEESGTDLGYGKKNKEVRVAPWGVMFI